MGSSTPRAIAMLCAYFLVTLPLMPVQAVLLGVGAPLARRLPYRYHRLICRVLGIEVEIHGAISVKRPTLFVCNHVSYLDIEVICATIEASFVTKREVAGYPIFALLTKLQRTIFVDQLSIDLI